MLGKDLNMGKYITAYLGTAVVFFTLDVIWLLFITKNFYKNEIGHLLLDQPNLSAAAIFSGEKSICVASIAPNKEPCDADSDLSTELATAIQKPSF